jgi:hypothetical protein
VNAPYLGLAITECGVGRCDPSKRDTALTRDYYYYMGRKARENNIAICIWCDYKDGWFACCNMEGGVCCFQYGLADAFLTCQR